MCFVRGMEKDQEGKEGVIEDEKLKKKKQKQKQNRIADCLELGNKYKLPTKKKDIAIKLITFFLPLPCTFRGGVCSKWCKYI